MGIQGGQQTHEVGIHLPADNTLGLLRFYKAVFRAEETYRLAEARAVGARIAGVHFTILQSGCRPKSHDLGPMVVYVPNADWAMDHALDLGAQLVFFLGSSKAEPVVDTPDGDRAGRFRDPSGYLWELRTRLEDVSPDDALRRARERRVKRC